MDGTKCKERVFPRETWGAFHPHQCSRKKWKDGYCKQHHPDTVKARQEAQEKEWATRRKREQEQSPYTLLEKANDKIKELEAEIERLKGLKCP